MGLGRKRCSSAAGGLEDLPHSLLILYFIISLSLNWIKMVSQCQEPGDAPASRRQHCTRHGSEEQCCPQCPFLPGGPAPVLLRCSQVNVSSSPSAKSFLCLHRLQNHPAEPRTAGSPAEPLKQGSWRVLLTAGCCCVHGDETTSQRGSHFLQGQPYGKIRAAARQRVGAVFASNLG